MALRAVIYARYSNEKQSYASVEDQVHACRRHAERQGWHIVKVLADHAMSGRTDERPQFQELRNIIRQQRVDIVLTESIDRLSRDPEHLAGFSKLVRFAGVRIVTLIEGDASKFLIALKGVMGSEYLEELAQRTRRGLEGRIRAGRAVGGPPYGYRVIRQFATNGEPETGLREIDPAQAEIVQRIFHYYIGGMSPRRIARILNSESVPGPSGGIWYDASIRGRPSRGEGILRNPLYSGRLVWNRTHHVQDPETGQRHTRKNSADDVVVREEPSFRIIEEEIWQAAQLRLRKEGQAAQNLKPSLAASALEQPEVLEAAETFMTAPTTSNDFWNRRRPKYILSNKVVCGVCGQKFQAPGKDYLRCTGASNGACRNTRSVRRSKLEAHVLELLARQLLAPEDVALFVETFEAEWEAIRANLTTSTNAARREIAQLERKIGNLVDAIANRGANSALQAKLDQLTAEYDDRQAQCSAPPPVLPKLSLDIGKLYCRRLGDLSAAVNGLNAAECRERARDLIDQVIIHPPYHDGGEPQIELLGDLEEMLAFSGLADAKGDQAQAKAAVGMLASSVKEAPGAEPLAFIPTILRN